MSTAARLPSHRAPSLATQLNLCVLTLKSSHRPDGIFTCCARMLAGRRCHCLGWHGDLLIVHHHRQHSFICAYSRSKVPIAPMGIPADLPNRLSSFNSGRYLVLSGICTCQPRLQTSHRPDGRLTFCSLFAGRRCLCQRGRLSDLLIVHDHGQHSSRSACSPSNFPSPRWEKCSRACFDYRFAQLGMLRSTTDSMCRRRKFPSPRWEDG